MPRPGRRMDERGGGEESGAWSRREEEEVEEGRRRSRRRRAECSAVYGHIGNMRNGAPPPAAEAALIAPLCPAAPPTRLPATKGPDCCRRGAGGCPGWPPTRGLHSLTSQLNLSAFCGIVGARRDCVARVKGVLGGV